MNPKYVAPATQSRTELLAELACMVAAWSLTMMPLRALVAAALAMGIAVGISDLRGELLHDFKPDGPLGTLERQVEDSVNLASTNPLVRLFFPMGIGLHKLHHLAPWLPYHALRTAQARLNELSRSASSL
jgi:fatty acid desaturase